MSDHKALALADQLEKVFGLADHAAEMRRLHGVARPSVPTLKQAEILLKQHAGGLTDGWYQIDAGMLVALLEDWIDEHEWQNPPKLNSAWRKRHAIQYVSEDEVET